MAVGAVNGEPVSVVLFPVLQGKNWELALILVGFRQNGRDYRRTYRALRRISLIGLTGNRQTVIREQTGENRDFPRDHTVTSPSPKPWFVPAFIITSLGEEQGRCVSIALDQSLGEQRPVIVVPQPAFGIYFIQRTDTFAVGPRPRRLTDWVTRTRPYPRNPSGLWTYLTRPSRENTAASVSR